MRIRFRGLTAITLSLLSISTRSAHAATTQQRYYAYPAVEDRYGVIAPWYQGQNGQCDFRVRVSAETLKRYPWADADKAPAPAPEYIYNGNWQITPEGAITIPPEKDWSNGDLGQRAAATLMGLVEYYRYSGDAAAIAHMSMIADVLLDHEQTGADHPWPHFLVSCPTKGKPYGQADPHGMIQLDIVAQAGIGMLRAYQCAGNERWLKAAVHWAELMAQKRNRDPKLPPWNRYANPEDVGWEDTQTGGVVVLLQFFDECIRLGYTGADNCIVEARDAGRAYLRDTLLPRWAEDPTWGHHYWDWPHPVQGVIVTDAAAHYLMSNPEIFPNWRSDVRNILSLFLNRSSVSPNSNGDVYSGAWAYPEGSSCCGRSLDNPPPLIALALARYGVLADSAWGRELARRQAILFTYDCHETGGVEDNIDGGQIIAANWFKAAHPGALLNVLGVMAWLPEVLGPNRENHIMRSTSVIDLVQYRKGEVEYWMYDAPTGTVDVLRLAFRPKQVIATGPDGEIALPLQPDTKMNAYSVKELSNGDCIVTIRHDGLVRIVITGDDAQNVAGHTKLTFRGEWILSTNLDPTTVRHGIALIDGDFEKNMKDSAIAGAEMIHTFKGNQGRVVGIVDSYGGLADVYLDGVKQLVGIDCWNPDERHQQVLYHRSGLKDGEHTLKIVVRGEGNPRSRGKNVYVDAMQWSAATGDAGSGEGGGPTDAQRWIFGYTGRDDYVDTQGHAWRPATEFVVRAGHHVDSVAATWWTQRRRLFIADTPDPELYRYGVHAPEFTVNFTVGPGTYHARLKFAETRQMEPAKRAVNIHINGKNVVSNMDIVATAGGLNRAVDLVFNNLEPQHGIIDIRLSGSDGGEAIVQAIEVAPGDGGQGTKPTAVTTSGPVDTSP